MASLAYGPNHLARKLTSFPQLLPACVGGDFRGQEHAYD